MEYFENTYLDTMFKKNASLVESNKVFESVGLRKHDACAEMNNAYELLQSW